MVRDDLVFQWQESERFFGYKFIAALIVTVVFTGLFGIVDVRLEPPRAPSFDSAAVLHFADDDLRQVWTQMAEEAGPFPGRLEIAASEVMPSLGNSAHSVRTSDWSNYETALRDFKEDAEASAISLAPKGVRYFPQRVKVGVLNENIAPYSPSHERSVILTPFDGAALKWMPENTPVFEMPADGAEFSVGSWRFMLRLRPDGSVSDSISLGGAGETGTEAVALWLDGLRFGAGEGERWLGLRVEFINQ